MKEVKGMEGIVKIQRFENGNLDIDLEKIAGISISEKPEIVKAAIFNFSLVSKNTEIEIPRIIYCDRDIWIGSIQISKKVIAIETFGIQHINNLPKISFLIKKILNAMWKKKISYLFFPICPRDLPQKTIIRHNGKADLKHSYKDIRIVENCMISISKEERRVIKSPLNLHNQKIVWACEQKISLGKPNGKKIPITFENGEVSDLTVLNNGLGVFVKKQTLMVLPKNFTYIGESHIGNGLTVAVSKNGERSIFYPLIQAV